MTARDPECTDCGHPESAHDQDHLDNLCKGFIDQGPKNGPAPEPEMAKPPEGAAPDIRSLYFAGGQEEGAAAYYCGKCHCVIQGLTRWVSGAWVTEIPKRCYTCDSSLCSEGHVVEPRGYCRPCNEEHNVNREAEALAKAEVVTDYDGPVFHDNRFYMSMEEICDYEEVPEDRPARVFCATKHKPHLDAKDLLQSIEENANVEDYEFDWDDTKGLQTLLDAWLAKQTPVWYEEDQSRCVEIPKEWREGAHD